MARNLLPRGTFINYYNTFLCIAHSTTNFLHLATPLVNIQEHISKNKNTFQHNIT